MGVYLTREEAENELNVKNNDKKMEEFMVANATTIMQTIADSKLMGMPMAAVLSNYFYKELADFTAKAQYCVIEHILA